VKYKQLKDDLDIAIERQQLYEAINKLPEVQAKRIYAYYFLGMTHEEIALNEGIARSTVTQNLDRALNNLKKYF
jgi:RNA polymerase sigma-70 factor (ECF subfamily)